MFNINDNELSYGRGYVHSLQYHLVWCTKYRKKVLKDGIDAECKEMQNLEVLQQKQIWSGILTRETRRSNCCRERRVS